MDAKNLPTESVKSNFEVDVSPEMEIYSVLRHLNYEIESALAEFIDNSIQSFIENNTFLSGPLNISITIDTINQTITIEDNAAGITREAFQRAIKLGTKIGETHQSDSLSVYGIGMKTAALWFSDQWRVITSAMNTPEELSFAFNLHKIHASGSAIANVITSPAASELHFTRIVLHNHNRAEDRVHYQERVIPFILETFHRFLEFTNIEFFFDGELLHPTKKKFQLDLPEELLYPVISKQSEVVENKLVRWKTDIDLEFRGHTVKGFIMLRKVGSYKQPGIRLFRNNRVIEGTTITPNIPANLLGTSNKYGAQRIYGELSLDEFPVDFMKIRFNENLSELYKELRIFLSQELNVDFIFQTDNLRKKKINSELIKQLTKANAFRKIQKGKDTTLDVNAQVDNSSVTPEPQIDSSDTTVTSTETATDNESGINHAPVETNESNDESVDTSTAALESIGDITTNNKPSNSSIDYRIEYSEVFHNLLKRLEGNKIDKLYKSLTTISLNQHGVLAMIGAWCFLECVTASIGRRSDNDFKSFINNRLGNYRQLPRDERNVLKRVVQDIAEKGNCNKHDSLYSDISASDLKNAFIILERHLTIFITDHLNSTE